MLESSAYGLLRGVMWLKFTDISGHPVDPFILNTHDLTENAHRNVGKLFPVDASQQARSLSFKHASRRKPEISLRECALKRHFEH